MMITQAICFVFARAVETAAVAALLMAAAWAARVEKRTWERAAICAALIVGVTWSLAAAGALIPLFGGLLATAVAVALWYPLIGGALDTTDLKAAAVWSAAVLTYVAVV